MQLDKINFVYHQPFQFGSGYFGSEGLKRALAANQRLNYAYNQTGLDVLDINKLQSAPIFYVRGFLHGRMGLVARGGNQFKACWQSESFYTRHGEMDVSTPLTVENQKHFNMMFTCADTDLEMYEIPTYHLPSWIDTDVMYEIGQPKLEGLGFVGGRQGREDFLGQDKTGIIKQVHTDKIKDPVKMTLALSELISKFSILVSPPGRCFNGMCGRTWEIMACNRLCLAYFNPDTMQISSKFFADGEDLVYWQTFDELLEKYKYYLAHKEDAQRIARNGCFKVRQFHNQDVRVKYILDCMSTEHEKWLKDQALIPDAINEIYAQL